MKKNWLYLFCTYISYFILHIEIHRHHILALLLGYIGAIFVNGCKFILDFCHVEDYPYHLLNAFLSLLYSLALVLTKYSMIKYILLSPYVFLFYNRIFYIFISFIITFLQYPMIINLPDRNTRIDKSEENNKYFSNNFLEIIKIFIGQKSGFYIFFFIFHFFFFLLYYKNIDYI